ncbi:DUF637 domain-containing protein [Pandoraea sputorum]|uniref:DUF637 domain-containing protein n=1 Tax=Pandoraea sputorum TaxID=93222 RepID=UPI002AF6B818|nr:DUF637 domain-containing protein [Pandoraea sputorum]
MPQVYLPENFTALSAGGQILASNDLSLNFGSTATGGSILNTGSITSGGTLTVNTGTLTNRANVVDVGEIWSYIKDAGYLKTTGTMVQPGGFMSAAAGGLTLNVDQFNQIGGALQLLGQNGEVDQAATQAFIAGVAAQLGDNFVQQTLQNDLHTDFVKQGGSFGIQQVGMIMASAMLAGALAPLMAGMVAAQLGSVAATFVAGGLGNVMASAALTAMASSTLTQAMFTGSLDFGSVLKTGLSAAVTAGLLNGITYSSADGLGFSTTASPNSLSSLAGVKPTFVEGTASQAGTASAGFSITQGVAILGQSVIQAGVQSTIQGGSFLDALKASGVSNLSAALAFQIGDAKGDLSQIFGQNGGEIVSTIAHGALGCASAAALGNGCAGGAIGGALGSALNSILDPSQVLPPELHVGFMGLAGALVAGALGQDANAAATAAQNETQNNWLKHKADGFNKPSEADQLKAAASACSASGNLNSESCGKLNDLRAVSLARDQALTIACADSGSAACMLAVADAKANGNIVVRASNGQLFAVDPADSQILSGDPNPKATLLEAQKGSSLGGIFSGLIVALGGSTETALEGARLGQAVEGVGAGVTSFGTPRTASPVAVVTENAKNNSGYSAIGSTGKVGEQYLQSLGGRSQVYFSTSLGGRYVDQLINGIANESKVGYTSFTSSVQIQIAKDLELMNSGAVNSVNWHFFTSPITGLGGPSQPLLKALQSSGIGVVVH